MRRPCLRGIVVGRQERTRPGSTSSVGAAAWSAASSGGMPDPDAGRLAQVTAMMQAESRGTLPGPAGGAAHPVVPQGVELRHLRYFVAVVDAGTFTRAAERMSITQPTLSQQIRRLEEMVGTPLLFRRKEGVWPTAAGIVLLDESRIVLSLVDQAMSRTRQAAGLGRPRLRVAVHPGLPETVAVAAASRLRGAAAAAGVDVAWLETTLDTDFSLIRQRRADAGLGWLTPTYQRLPEPLDVMNLGEFEPEAWIHSSHPAARLHTISVRELAGLDVVHGPRRASAGTYDAWLNVLRATDPRFEFSDPPFRQSLPMTLAFAATATRPTVVLTGPRHLTGLRDAAWRGRPVNSCDMVPVRVGQSPLAATAALVWSGDLPNPLQQILFDAADGLTL
jgi:DNA-binding transcriptional LysR family regulator